MHLPCFLPDFVLTWHADDRWYCHVPDFVQKSSDRISPPSLSLWSLSCISAMLGLIVVVGMLLLAYRLGYIEKRYWGIPVALASLWLAFRLMA